MKVRYNEAWKLMGCAVGKDGDACSNRGEAHHPKTMPATRFLPFILALVRAGWLGAPRFFCGLAFVMASGSINQGSGYTWSQTKEELTLYVTLPTGVGARNVEVCTAGGEVRIGLKNAPEPLVQGTLPDPIAGSVWSVERSTLSLELEKARPKFWATALRGEPMVDVEALIAQEKRDREPAYKPDPNAEAVPRQVTDKETLRKLKAEFPQLELPIADAHTATHQNFAGKRSAFDWGALPIELDEQAAAPPPAAPPPPPPPLPVSPPTQAAAASATATKASPPSAQAAVAHGEGDGKYAWGALPGESDSGGGGMYAWGALPGDGSNADGSNADGPCGGAASSRAEGGNAAAATRASQPAVPTTSASGQAGPQAPSTEDDDEEAMPKDDGKQVQSAQQGTAPTMYHWGPLPIG